MIEKPADTLAREKILYRYTSAVERGNFEAAGSILAQAEGDPQLEQMIVEINAALSGELPPAPRVPARPVAFSGGRGTSFRQRLAVPETFWYKIGVALRRAAPGVGLGLLAFMVVVLGLALMGPAVGNIFRPASGVANRNADASRFRLSSQGEATYTPYAPAANVFQAQQAYPAYEPTATPYFSQPAAAAGGPGPGIGYPAPNGAFVIQPTHTPYVPKGAPARSAAATATTRASGASSAFTASTPNIDTVTGGAILPGGVDATTPPRMVVRNAYLALTVADTRKARDAVSAMISEYAEEGAFILTSAEQAVPIYPGSEQPYQPGIYMQLRVPVARYDILMNRLVGLALSVDARQEQASDVTAEYVDTQARIRELQTAINRLLEIAQSAQNTTDLLTVEKALSDRRAELEALEGRAQYLSQTAALSLIQLELRPKMTIPTPTITPTRTPTPVPTTEAWRPGETAQGSARVLLNDLRHFADWLIVVGITRLPWIAVVGLVGVGGYRLLRRRRSGG